MSQYYLNKPKDITVILDPNGQEANVATASQSGSQTVNVYDKNFKFAQNLRMNLGFDFKALGIDWTAEAIYSKTLNDILYKNLAVDETARPTDRPITRAPTWHSTTVLCSRRLPRALRSAMSTLCTTPKRVIP